MFRPSLHGWPFRNAYTCTGSQLGAAGPPAAGLGLGGGLCWAALDRYFRGVPIPRDVPAPSIGDPLHAEFVQRQVAALAGEWPRIRSWQDRPEASWRDALPVPVPVPGGDLASRTRRQWASLRRRLNAGEPVLLTLLLQGDRYHRPGAVRQVLATGWARNGFRITLSLYDPDCPDDDDVRLAFSVAGPLDARLTGGNSIRGFFMVPYDRARLPTVRVEPFDDRSVLGLNRKVRERPDQAVGRKQIELVARNEEGALLHFRRNRGDHWEGTNVTESADLGAWELHAPPAAIRSGGRLYVYSRSYAGDMLLFRRGRRWTASNVTEKKRIGARFRIAGAPVAVPGSWLRQSVLGRDASGGLVHYWYRPLIGWRAEQVPGDPVAGDPSAARVGAVLHVIGLADDGRVLHWARRDEWTLMDTDIGDGPRVRLVGTPELVVHDGRLYVFGRDRDRRLAVLTLDDDGGWRRSVLAEDLAGDPKATVGPAGLHVFAPTTTGLIHATRAGSKWHPEDLVASRTTITPVVAEAASLACWGTRTALRVFVRRHTLLRSFTWTPSSDWVADPLTDRVRGDPVLFHDARGAPHLVCTDAGTILHLETGPWREPERTAGAPWIHAATYAAPGRGPDQEADAEAGREPIGSAPQAAPTAASLAEADPGDDADVLDFDAERRAGGPDGREPDVPTPGGSGSDPSESGPREYRWEEPSPAAADDIEPMDLSLMDTWPPPTRSRRTTAPDGETGEADREGDADAGREAS